MIAVCNFLLLYLESDGNANNYVKQTLGHNTTETIILIVGSILGGIILLLLLAIIVLPLTVLGCHKYRSRHLIHQQ